MKYFLNALNGIISFKFTVFLLICLIYLAVKLIDSIMGRQVRHKLKE